MSTSIFVFDHNISTFNSLNSITLLEMQSSEIFPDPQVFPRNISRHPASLPPEILSYIFELVQDNYFQSDPFNEYSWVPAVTHVCTTWREVALSTPWLWTHITLYQMEWGKEVLRRAQRLPLHVTIRAKLFGNDLNDIRQGITLMKAAFDEPNRIRSINIALAHHPDAVSEALSELIGTHTMPLLESICIYSYSSPCRIMNGTFKTEESAPRLKTLIVMDGLLDFTTHRFQNLRYLELSAALGPFSRINDLQPFCVALGEMHDLEWLKLLSVLPLEMDEEALGTVIPTPILLPRLREVQISDSFEPLPFFQRTRAPSLNYASVDLFCCEEPWDVVANISGICEFAASTMTDESTKIHLQITESGIIRDMNYNLTGDKDTPKTLSFHFALDEEAFWSNVPPVSSVSSFILDSTYSDPLYPSYNLSRYLISLSESDTVTTLVLPYTIILPPEPPGALGGFPALETLVLSSFPYHETSAEQLLECLRLREARGFPRLKKLHLLEWIEPSVVQALRLLVDCLTIS